MKLWHKQTVRRDDNGKRIVILSKRFYGTIRLADGKRKQVPLSEDRQQSKVMLRRLQTTEDEARANGSVVRPVNSLLGDKLTDYQAVLLERGDTAEYAKVCELRLRKLFHAVKATTINDLNAARISTTLAAWRKRTKQPIGVETSNHYIRAVKCFSRWLYRERMTPHDQLSSLKTLNASADRRRLRRALTTDEFTRLSTATQKSKRTYLGNDWQFRPSDRAMLYTLAVYTGLRARELSSLTKSAFDFEANTITLAARFTKNRKGTTLPLSPTLTEKLKPYLAALKTDQLFPGSWPDKRLAGKMLKRDLKRAKIPFRDDQQRQVDFHSLRHTFVTWLAKANVHPAIAQRLARHSTITLTMNAYTQLEVADLRPAIALI